MVAIPVPQRVIVPLAPLGGACAGLLVALALLAVPTSLLEQAVAASRISAVLPAAEPPLGVTARMALAFVLGSGTGVLVWCALLLAFGTRGLTLGARGLVLPKPPRIAGVALGKEDADAPRRAPVIATRELGTPFLEVRAKPAAEPEDAPAEAAPARVERAPSTRAAFERSLPRDLSAPLAAYDPAAIPEVPAEPVRPVAPLAELPQRIEAIEPEEPEVRIETPDPTPSVRASAAPAVEPVEAPIPIATPKTDATIHALLDRLERGVARRDAAAAAAAAAAKSTPALQDTLAELRTLAAR